ncbi:developmentally-regulated protein [Acrasis kona]|uniref:Developmentally-regulated protein n=1 Tax=Acrasis kona TaxID=1008807 RepID=A0AAW2Z4X9_9EUKA
MIGHINAGGYFACPFCKKKGMYLNNCVCYPPTENDDGVLRTEEHYRLAYRYIST